MTGFHVDIPRVRPLQGGKKIETLSENITRQDETYLTVLSQKGDFLTRTLYRGKEGCNNVVN